MAIFDGKKGEPIDGYLGSAAEVEGTLRFRELLRVDGTVRGKVISDNELVVGESGVDEAEVDVGRLSVAGRVTGKITIRERIEIHAGGRVSGELHMKTPVLLIEEGGILEGQVHMGGLAEGETGAREGNDAPGEDPPAEEMAAPGEGMG